MKYRTPYRFPVTLTNKAKDKMRELSLNERSFFSLEKSFHIYIEKYPQEAGRPLSVALFFDHETNANLAAKYKECIFVLHCVVEQDRFIATNVSTRSRQTPVSSNWRRAVMLEFDLNVHNRERVSFDLLRILDEMPVAQESSMYVKKRIASWEGYLKIQERSADIPDMTSRYSGLIFNGDFSRVTIKGIELGEKEWKSLKDLSVKLKGIDQDIGKVLKANCSARTVEVELHGYIEGRARKGRLDVHPKEVVFSNFATLSQVKRLRQGFKHLENGLAVNSDLERLLFENKPPVKPVTKQAKLKFHNRLNEFQQEAVSGAMSAEDLYVIQGPPGTGKTTVISEICFQNAKAGLRTLVASQSNLAVDNALSRLLANKDIRILRVGRTESIEEEGKKFIEENVGQYWKDHTLHEVSTQFKNRQNREKEIEIELAENEREQEAVEVNLKRVKAELEAKQDAQHQFNEIKAQLDEHKKNVEVAEQERQAVEKQKEQINKSLQTLNSQIEEDDAFLLNQPDSIQIVIEQEENEHLIEQLKQSIASEELAERINEKKKTVEQIVVEHGKWSEAVKQMNGFIDKVKAIKQVDGLKWFLLEQNITRNPRMHEYMKEIERIRAEVNQLEKLKSYHDKLTRAITYVEQLLTQHSTKLNQLQQRAITNSKAYTASEIDYYLDELRNRLKETSAILPQMLMNALEGLYSRRHFIRIKAKRLKPFESYKQMAQESFHFLKQEVVEELEQNQRDNKLLFQQSMKEVEEENEKLESLQNEYQQKYGSFEPISNAKERLREIEAKRSELQKLKDQIEQANSRVEENRERRNKDTVQLEEVKQQFVQLEARLIELNELIARRQAEQESLTKWLETEPEQEHEKVLTKMASLSLKRDSLIAEKKRFPLFQSIQGKWLSLLEEAGDHDLEEIRKLYVKHANVIGTTCVASARKDFIESYPEFDVVIIDEVSKATPPELLLPMLKGKKIILVGDHHQLPPLIGNDTLEETLQELADGSDDFEGKEELNKLLKESLFERLFKNLPKSNKTMLAIQYRMHENIMETITPFYEQENERLQCGLLDSDSDRDHLLQSQLIKRENHLIWFDMPNTPSYFEERMKGGKSLYNPAELKNIADLLIQLNDATAEAKQAGRMKANELKSVGVISFYGEQVKRIDRLIEQELRLEHLTIRTGTVDRFQGMEMDVILLSMVRNHDNRQDDIGFAKDYRRLNVALSRARELLILIGSTKMFTERTKQAHARKMYQHVLDVAKKQNGLRTLEEVANG
nr:AAA domain-containing protein [Halalkalibacter krulwichiae]